MIEYLALLGLYMALAWVTGMAVGEWRARRDASRIAARRDALTMLALADAEVASRLRHPSAR